MNTRLIFFFLLLLICSCESGTQKRILFIGNSYTYRNNMPFLFHQICERKGESVYVQHITKGKYTFYLQSRRKLVQRALSKDDNWDIIVLQGSSRDFLKSDKILKTRTYPAIERLLKRININQPKAKVYFYMTWPYKYGYKKMKDANTRKKMYTMLLKRFSELKERYHLPIVPVGDIWYRMQLHQPEINLYTKDRSHPSLAGSYLTAYTFYSVLFNKTTRSLQYHSLLSPKTASTLKEESNSLLQSPEIESWYK